jgi:FKBP-type peptidyl-prolyl cis-trans isomerase
VQKINIQFVSALFVIVIGLTLFSFATAGTPEENKVAGEKFLAENAKKPNIKTTASGLQYEVITPGSGKTNPKATDTVTVHYKGTSIDGKEFDSSYSRGTPTSFPLNGVIPGWTEGVQLMTEGAKYKFYIPSNLAYGENGAGRSIGPNETLIFDVELIKIN